ncbi:hypothetical protein J437_LFUL017495 [Ladona fulva]|uniref:DDE Tnp4 domain-containing protein n=1 Tax=Ladona fulva TaxID=123851 RepID=A0A8K0KP46_LADFU|nr:hypothetical protein J437_LFUL017495 [Ladona fulva]
MREAISPHVRLIATLQFLATGSFQDLKFSMRVSPQKLGEIIMETSVAIRKALQTFIQVSILQLFDKTIGCGNKSRIISNWQFPNCLGAVDGKHIQIKNPANSGSHYFNYKGTCSVVMMVIVDANYEVSLADVGTNGRISDGGVIKKTAFYESQKWKLNIPLPKHLPGSNKTSPNVFVGDEAFKLQDNFMKPYSFHERRIFNRRLSRGRSVVEFFLEFLFQDLQYLKNPSICRQLRSIFCEKWI